MRTYESIQKAFPGAQTPAQVVVKAADVTAPRGAAGHRRAEAAGPRDRPDGEPIETEVNPAQTVEVVSIPLQGNGDNGASVAGAADAAQRRDPGDDRQVPGVVPR